MYMSIGYTSFNKRIGRILLDCIGVDVLIKSKSYLFSVDEIFRV